MNLRKNGYYRCLTVIVLAALLLTGCVQKPPADTTTTATNPQPTETTAATAPTQTEPTVTVPPTTEPLPTETEPTEPPPSLEPLTLMGATQWKSYPELHSLGGGIVLASRPRYNYGNLETSMELIDVYADTVVAMQVLPGVYEPVGQRFDDGAIVMGCNADSTFYVYDDGLNLIQTIPAPNVEGYFSYDRQWYYCVEGGVLYRMEVASGNQGRLALQWDLRLDSLAGIHPQENLLIARVNLSWYSEICGLAVIDGNTGKIRLLSDEISSLMLDGDSFCATQMNAEAYGYDVLYGPVSGEDTRRLTPVTLGGEGVHYSVLDESGYLVRRSALPEDVPCSIYDLTNGAAACDLRIYGFDKTVQGAIYLPEEQLIMGYYAYDSTYYKPVRIDPKVLEFSETDVVPETTDFNVLDESIATRYLAEAEGPTLSDELAQVRQLADDIEEQFDVQILISTQALQTCTYSGFDAATADEPEVILAGLQTLRAALSKYPDGFLAQFRNSADEGGLYFSLVGTIEGSLNPVGFAGMLVDRYNVAVDITTSEPEKTIHHEIWHAIEMKVSTDSFDADQWSTCNPADFSYYGRYSAGYTDLTRWTYAAGNGESSFFVDAYSRINAREDRARIMEYVMADDAEGLLKADAIRSKLEIMTQVIRGHFDTDGWTDVYWETYL